MNGQVIRRLLLVLSFLLVPVTLNYFSPVLIIAAAFSGAAGGAFFVWSAMGISSLWFGRAFCAYVCPYGGFQMILHRAGGKELRVIRCLPVIKNTLGIAWVALIVFAAARGGLTSADFFYLTESYVSMDNIYGVYLYLIIFGGFFVMTLFLGRRSGCRYLCPMSILNMAGTRIKDAGGWFSLRLSARPEQCTDCLACNRACPMSLDVHGMVRAQEMENSECILCGECAAACKQGVISRGFRRR